MSTSSSTPSPEQSANLVWLRAEVERLRAEVEKELGKIEEAQIPQTTAETTLTDEQTAQLTGASIIAGQYNTADAETALECTTPGITLQLRNDTQPVPASTPIGLYTVARGIGIIVSAFGVPAFPVVSKAVQAYCQNGPAVWAMSPNNSAIYAYTTNGDAAVVADQGSQNPTSHAIIALGGYGIGLYASGANAAVQLGKSSTAGPPTSGWHEAGQLVLDANADLYLCKASGSPGTWNLIG
jgi:hypothetical protein